MVTHFNGRVCSRKCSRVTLNPRNCGIVSRWLRCRVYMYLHTMSARVRVSQKGLGRVCRLSRHSARLNSSLCCDRRCNATWEQSCGIRFITLPGACPDISSVLKTCLAWKARTVQSDTGAPKRFSTFLPLKPQAQLLLHACIPWELLTMLLSHRPLCHNAH